MIKTIKLSYVIPLVSTLLLMLGNGLYNTIISIRLKVAHEPDILIGFMTSIYYLGMLIGAFSLSSIVIRIGHIRSFAAFGALLSIATLVPGMSQNLFLWSIARFIAGYSLAGLYITIESWILNMSNKNNRGKYMALYTALLYTGLGCGQFLLNITDYATILPFCISAILTMIAIIPISMMVSSGPQIEEPDALSFKELYRVSPTGLIGCLVSGMLLASIYGLLPVYLKTLGYGIDTVATVMGITILGGVVLQYPFGHLSDIVDRRIAIIIICLLGAIICFVFITADYFFAPKELGISIMAFVFGGMLFSLYPICMSHTCDFIKPSNIVAATQGMLLSYGIGSVTGPIIVSTTMQLAGPYALFGSFMAFILALGIFTFSRILKSKKTIETTEELFIASPHTTPISSSLDPRAEETNDKTQPSEIDSIPHDTPNENNNSDEKIGK